MTDQPKPPVNKDPWTAEEDAFLRSMYGKGFTARMIGQQLNRSKGSVIGRADRLNLTGRSYAELQSKKKKPKRALLVEPKPVGRPKEHVRALHVPLDLNRILTRDETATGWRAHVHSDRKFEPISRRVSILDITDRQCKYSSSIANDKIEGFCGHTTKPGSSYCPYHHVACYTTEFEEPYLR